MKWNPLYGLGCMVVVIVALVILAGSAIFRGCSANKAASTFAGMESQAREVCAKCIKGEAIGSKPYRTGKVLVVHRLGDTVSHTMVERTLKGIVASSPDEVSTYICVGPVDMQRVGEYSGGGGAAYRLSREICIIDRKTGEILYKTILTGSPPSDFDNTGTSSGSDPEYAELTAFIRSLAVQ
jgi:hypothetical protein